MDVNFYIPSESYVVLNKKTWMPEIKLLRFLLISGPKGLLLHCSSKYDFARVSIPESACQVLLENKSLTASFVNHWLEPYKKIAIEELTSNAETVNVSFLLSSACGYATKNGQYIILFDQNTLQVDPFSDTSLSLKFSLPFNTNQTVLMASEDYIGKSEDIISFMLYTKEQLLQIDCVYKNQLFYIQRLLPVSEMAFQKYFEEGHPLDFIYKRIIGKKSRLKSLLNSD